VKLCGGELGASASPRRHGRGRGVGAANCSGLVESHDGQVSQRTLHESLPRGQHGERSRTSAGANRTCARTRDEDTRRRLGVTGLRARKRRATPSRAAATEGSAVRAGTAAERFAPGLCARASARTVRDDIDVDEKVEITLACGTSPLPPENRADTLATPARSEKRVTKRSQARRARRAR